MPTIAKPGLYLNFKSAFYQDLIAGRINGLSVLEWASANGQAAVVTPSELYRMAIDLSRAGRPVLPVRYWFYRLLQASGHGSLQLRRRFDGWVSRQPLLQPLFGAPFSTLSTQRFDLSRESRTVRYAGTPDQLLAFQGEIDRLLTDSNCRIGYGGYGEVRDFYRAEARGDFPEDETPPSRLRNRHLGIDFWTRAGTPVYAPLEGTVYALADSKNVRGFGPALVLFHVVEPGTHFYTLYGHLDPEILRFFRVGQKIRAGRLLGHIGSPEVNGQWPPHLHFQVNLDMLGQRTHFYGVGYNDEWKLWESLCPDPELLLR